MRCLLHESSQLAIQDFPFYFITCYNSTIGHIYITYRPTNHLVSRQQKTICDLRIANIQNVNRGTLKKLVHESIIDVSCQEDCLLTY